MSAMVGVGVDVVDIARFRTTLARRPGLARRLFVESELAHVSRRADAAPSLAARFAAREAAMKVLGVGLGAFGFHDVWVESDSASGRPTLRVEGRARELADAAGVDRWHLSLSHTDSVAVAVVSAD